MSHTLCPTEVLDEKCRESVAATLSNFQIDVDHASIPAEATLWSLLVQSLTHITRIFSLSDPKALLSEPTTMQQILRAVFPSSTLAFFTPETCTTLLSGLEEPEKALMLAQAICATVVLYCRLNDAEKDICGSLLAKELQLFTEGDQLRTVLEKLEGSHVFGQCFMKAQIEDAMVDAVMAARKDDVDLPSTELGVDSVYAIGVGAMGGVESEAKKWNMGLPWGFTIMALN